MKQIYRFSKALILGLVFSISPALGETAAQKGLRIATSASEKTRGYSDLSVTGEMVLKSKGNTTSTRRFEARWVEVENGKTRSVLIFEWPGDIANTALLTHSFDQAKDDQWLYLPAISKVRRISSSGRSGSFVGSEFAYEDMVDQDVSKFNHTWIKREQCPGQGQGTCDVIDRVPLVGSGYSRQRVWFDVKNLRLQKVQYFDRRGALQKTLRISNYKLYNKRFWRAELMDMQNHITGKSTRLGWTDYKFNTGINPSTLTVNTLKRLK